MQFLYHGGVIHEDADLMIENKRRVRLMRAMLQAVRSRAILYGNSPAQPGGLHADGRGD